MILPQPTEEQLRAMLALSQHPQFSIFAVYLREAEGQILDSLVGATDTAKMHRWQGSAQTIRAVSDAFGAASAALQRMSQGRL